MKNIKLIIAYDGTRYDGWQKQGNTQNTIQGKLEKLISKMVEEEISLYASGRTDAGVHAYAQVANFHTNSNLSLKVMKEYMEQYLPKDISIIKIEEVEERFHSRLNATEKYYMYRIWNSRKNNVFERNYTLQILPTLDMNKMKEASKYLIGEHDFKSFCANKHMKKSTVRIIYDINIEKQGDEIQFTFHGNGFLYNMIRIIIGTLIEIGLGKRQPKEMLNILEAKDREKAGFTAPPLGLFLVEVKY